VFLEPGGRRVSCPVVHERHTTAGEGRNAAHDVQQFLILSECTQVRLHSLHATQFGIRLLYSKYPLDKLKNAHPFGNYSTRGQWAQVI
jgi:hypothetical protein